MSHLTRTVTIHKLLHYIKQGGQAMTLKSRTTVFPKTQARSNYLESLRNTGSIRSIIGLPQLHETDKNSVLMHNCHIEKEDQYIEKKMGVSDRRTNIRIHDPQGHAGIKSLFGY